MIIIQRTQNVCYQQRRQCSSHLWRTIHGQNAHLWIIESNPEIFGEVESRCRSRNTELLLLFLFLSLLIINPKEITTIRRMYVKYLSNLCVTITFKLHYNIILATYSILFYIFCYYKDDDIVLLCPSLFSSIDAIPSATLFYQHLWNTVLLEGILVPIFFHVG